MTSEISSNHGRFRWGLNIDDLWKYTGLGIPNSVVVPYLLSVPVHQDGFRLPREDAGQTAAPSSPTSRRAQTVDGRSPEALASFLRERGVDFVRCWFQWNFFQDSVDERESTSGSKDAGFVFPLDDFVSKMNGAGIRIIGAIGSGYQRFLPAGLGTDRLNDYLVRLRDSSTQIVRHYKYSVKVWQIENEPNWWWAHYTSQWRKGLVWLRARNQEAILRTLHDVVRSESPDAAIIVNLKVDDKRANWGLYSKYCDILGLDWYPNYLRSTPDTGADLRRTASRIKKETGLPIIVVETGYPSSPKVFGFNEMNQSQYVRAACEAAYSCDAISGLGWFRFSDSHWRSFPPQENHFGLLNREGTPKAGWGEFVSQIVRK